MNIALLRDELRRVEARLAELEGGPRPRRDLARDAATSAVDMLREERASKSVVKHADFRFQSVEKFVAPSGKRTIRGIASSASVDRVGDIVEPSGGKWRLPVILLAQHDHNRPIGWVRSLQVKGNELHVEAEIAQGIGDADAVFAMVEARLLTGFSIGFRALPGGTESIPGGGIRFRSWELLELSICAIPMQADATIQHVGVTPGKSERQHVPIKVVDRNAGAVKLSKPRIGSIPLIRNTRHNLGAVKLNPGYIRLQKAEPPKRPDPLPGGAVRLSKQGK